MTPHTLTSTWLVTGGAGFIGSNFVRRARAAGGARLVVFDKLTYAGHLESLDGVLDGDLVTFVQGDIAEREDVRTLFERVRPSAIVNFAAESHVDRSIDAPGDFVRTNISGTFELLEASRVFLQGVTAGERAAFRFLHVSTDEVYGSLGPEGAFSETTPYAPNSPYSASKAAADHLVRAYHETYGLPTLLTNCSNNYGPYQFPEKLVPLMVMNALDGKPLPIYGDGLNRRDWLHVDDHCDAILRVLEAGVAGQKYNVGGNAERTNLEMVDAICAALELAAPAAANPALAAAGVTDYRDLKVFVKDRPGHDKRYAIDASKLARELGFIPRYSFQEGLNQTVAWYLANRAWCAAVTRGKYDRERLGLSVAKS
ncbi:MAG TPA: dTDP-glucose 4,6-dehydratase [Vicinamibacterales bacterium]|nr:dTDP-glucose 4,6-dehydratase [Vicinamibacterales bacterium]